MDYRITHVTVYDYTEPVTVSHHAARLTPRQTDGQQRVDFTLAIQPEPALRTVRSDYFGNRVAFFTIQEIHRRLEITATSRVSVNAAQPVKLDLSPAWEDVAALFRDPVSPEMVEPYQFVFDSPLLATAPDLTELARACFPARRPLLAAVAEFNEHLHREFQYDPKATSVATPLGEVVARRRGVCQDFAHVAIAALRSLGLPARYVSGYLRTRPREGEERLVGADASHAWFGVFCPMLGWIDFDPTNNCLPADEHITVGYGRDFSDVSPVSGIITGGGRHEVRVAVEVEPLTGKGKPE